MSKPSSAPPIIRSTEEFARYVGLARTTVSRVLNGQPGLRQQTIEKVRLALEETGFAPNAHAAHLRGRRTGMIGVCMENLHTPPIVAKLASLHRLLRQRGCPTLIEVLEPGRSRLVLQSMQSLRVDAVVFIGHFDAAEMERCIAGLRRQGLPHVVVDHVGIQGANTVSLDRAKSMRLMLEHLWAQGHRRFGLLGFTGQHRSTQNRLESAKAFVQEQGLNPAAALVSLDHLHERHDDLEHGRALGAAFARMEGRPTALVALNDEIAVGAMQGLQAAGLSVPGDVSVGGFNNLPICLVANPTLTTIDQQIEPTVAAAVEMVFAQIKRPGGPEVARRWIPPRLMVRQSTGPAAQCAR